MSSKDFDKALKFLTERFQGSGSHKVTKGKWGYTVSESGEFDSLKDLRIDADFEKFIMRDLIAENEGLELTGKGFDGQVTLAGVTGISLQPWLERNGHKVTFTESEQIIEKLDSKLSKSDVLEFSARIITEDYFIRQGVQNLHPSLQRQFLDSAFHRGPAAANWMLHNAVRKINGETEITPNPGAEPGLPGFDDPYFGLIPPTDAEQAKYTAIQQFYYDGLKNPKLLNEVNAAAAANPSLVNDAMVEFRHEHYKKDVKFDNLIARKNKANPDYKPFEEWEVRFGDPKIDRRDKWIKKGDNGKNTGNDGWINRANSFLSKYEGDVIKSKARGYEFVPMPENAEDKSYEEVISQDFRTPPSQPAPKLAPEDTPSRAEVEPAAQPANPNQSALEQIFADGKPKVLPIGDSLMSGVARKLGEQGFDVVDYDYFKGGSGLLIGASIEDSNSKTSRIPGVSEDGNITLSEAAKTAEYAVIMEGTNNGYPLDRQVRHKGEVVTANDDIYREKFTQLVRDVHEAGIKPIVIFPDTAPESRLSNPKLERIRDVQMEVVADLRAEGIAIGAVDLMASNLGKAASGKDFINEGLDYPKSVYDDISKSRAGDNSKVHYSPEAYAKIAEMAFTKGLGYIDGGMLLAAQERDTVMASTEQYTAPQVSQEDYYAGVTEPVVAENTRSDAELELLEEAEAHGIEQQLAVMNAQEETAVDIVSEAVVADAKTPEKPTAKPVDYSIAKFYEQMTDFGKNLLDKAEKGYAEYSREVQDAVVALRGYLAKPEAVKVADKTAPQTSEPSTATQEIVPVIAKQAVDPAAIKEKFTKDFKEISAAHNDDDILPLHKNSSRKGRADFKAETNQLQDVLVKLGYMQEKSESDKSAPYLAPSEKGGGFFGGKTYDAFTQFQRDWGISADGIRQHGAQYALDVASVLNQQTGWQKGQEIPSQIKGDVQRFNRLSLGEKKEWTKHQIITDIFAELFGESLGLQPQMIASAPPAQQREVVAAPEPQPKPKPEAKVEVAKSKPVPAPTPEVAAKPAPKKDTAPLLKEGGFGNIPASGNVSEEPSLSALGDGTGVSSSLLPAIDGYQEQEQVLYRPQQENNPQAVDKDGFRGPYHIVMAADTAPRPTGTPAKMVIFDDDGRFVKEYAMKSGGKSKGYGSDKSEGYGALPSFYEDLNSKPAKLAGTQYNSRGFWTFDIDDGGDPQKAISEFRKQGEEWRGYSFGRINGENAGFFQRIENPEEYKGGRDRFGIHPDGPNQGTSTSRQIVGTHKGSTVNALTHASDGNSGCGTFVNAQDSIEYLEWYNSLPKDMRPSGVDTTDRADLEMLKERGKSPSQGSSRVLIASSDPNKVTEEYESAEIAPTPAPAPTSTPAQTPKTDANFAELAKSSAGLFDEKGRVTVVPVMSVPQTFAVSKIPEAFTFNKGKGQKGDFTVYLDRGHGDYINGNFAPGAQSKIGVVPNKGIEGRGKPDEKTVGVSETDQKSIEQYYVAQALAAKGVNVRFTTEGDKVHGFSGGTDRRALQKSWQARAEFANNDMGEAKSVFFSLHSNDADAKQATGYETFHYSEQSKGYAEAVNNAVDQTSDLRSRGVKTNNFAVLRSTKMPAFLVEAGFNNNPDDFPELVDVPRMRARAEKMADAIYNQMVTENGGKVPELVAERQKNGAAERAESLNAELEPKMHAVLRDAVIQHGMYAHQNIKTEITPEKMQEFAAIMNGEKIPEKRLIASARSQGDNTALIRDAEGNVTDVVDRPPAETPPAAEPRGLLANARDNLRGRIRDIFDWDKPTTYIAALSEIGYIKSSDMGNNVGRFQREIGIKADEDLGPTTEYAIRMAINSVAEHDCITDECKTMAQAYEDLPKSIKTANAFDFVANLEPSKFNPIPSRAPEITEVFGSRYYPEFEKAGKYYSKDHKACDYRGKTGEEVVAPYSGEIVKSLGHHLILRTDNGLDIKLTHIDQLVREGQRVEAGEVIAKIAPESKNGGYATHLDFSAKITRTDVFIDPQDIYPQSIYDPAQASQLASRDNNAFYILGSGWVSKDQANEAGLEEIVRIAKLSSEEPKSLEEDISKHRMQVNADIPSRDEVEKSLEQPEKIDVVADLADKYQRGEYDMNADSLEAQTLNKLARDNSQGVGGVA